MCHQMKLTIFTRGFEMDENGIGEDYEQENNTLFWSLMGAIVVAVIVIVYLFLKG